VSEKIGITALKGIGILCADDIYDLARLLLKINDAKDRGTNRRSRHTVHGLASVYAMITGMSRDEIRSILESRGLPLGATVEYDEHAA